jgi:hypothetical protein
MKSKRDGINPAAKPSGTGCVECLALGGWWLHLRRYAECGHIGCCDSSPNRHASKHSAATDHPDNYELRAGRAVVLRLSHRKIRHRPEASRSSLSSVGSTGARTVRSGALKLANAASRIGNGLLVWAASHAVSCATKQCTDRSNGMFGQERENETRNVVVFLVQGEMAGVEQMDFGVRQIALERLRTRSDERGIVPPPDH